MLLFVTKRNSTYWTLNCQGIPQVSNPRSATKSTSRPSRGGLNEFGFRTIAFWVLAQF